MDAPRTRYARSADGTFIAYQVSGEWAGLLVAGSGLTFEEAGEHELNGVPDRWRLYRAVP